MRGRHPKPAHLHAIEGTRGKYRDELRPIAASPVPPAYLTAEQLARWQDIVESLPAGLLSKADTQVLERMSVAWASYRDVTGKILTAGLLVRGHLGEAVRNPLLIIRKQAAEEMHACGMVLGLSPLARARLANPKPNLADDPLAILLGLRPN